MAFLDSSGEARQVSPKLMKSHKSKRQAYQSDGFGNQTVPYADYCETVDYNVVAH